MDRSREFVHIVHLLDPTSIFPSSAKDVGPTSIGALLNKSNATTTSDDSKEDNALHSNGDSNHPSHFGIHTSSERFENQIGLGKEQQKQEQNQLGIGSHDEEEENCTEFRKGSNHISIGFRSTQSLLKR